jgi:cobalamin biosynthetic protein CobC
MRMKHGGDLTRALAQYGGTPAMWLDLSTGINPRPWPIPATLPDMLWQRLPSRADQDALIAAARMAYNLPTGVEIAAASGTQALIQWLPYLAGPGAVAIIGPTYSEHAAAWSSAGHEVIALTALDHLPDHARHVVIVNPNNPDGRLLDHATLAGVAALLRQHDGWLVIDEAFADLDPVCSAVALCHDLPVVILRSFGKFYGLAGLRLGFVIGPPAMIERVAQALGPWPCSGPALAIGRAALLDQEWADRAREMLKSQAGRLDNVLGATGFTIVGGTALFRLVRHGDAKAIHQALARQHIWCRNFEWADDLLRFGLPSEDEAFGRLAAALARCK